MSSQLLTRPQQPKLATSARSGRERRVGGSSAVRKQKLQRPRRLEVIADDSSRSSSAASAVSSARSKRVTRHPHSTVVTALASGLEVNVWHWDVVDVPTHGSLIPDLPAKPNDSSEPRRRSRCSDPSGPAPDVSEESFPGGGCQVCTEDNDPPIF